MALLIGNPVHVNDDGHHLKIHVYLLPVYAIAGFGLISLAIIFYRVYTFNECKEAYEELKKEIGQARMDLRGKGMDIDWRGEEEALNEEEGIE